MKKLLIIFSFLLALQLKGFSQDELLDTEGAPDPQGVPVDGGISLLLAAGAAYGVSRIRKRKVPA